MDFAITNLDQIESLLALMLGVDSLQDIDEQEPQYEEPINLATYYSPLFPQSQRTDEFKNLFKECFGSQSHICESMPRPLMCNDCFNKYINNTTKILNNNIIYKDVILPRLIEVQDMIRMINEHNRISHEQLNLDVIFDLLNINMDHYDPPSQTILDQCPITTYKKEDKDDLCVICQCDYDDGDQVKTLICQHQFHDQCVSRWLENHSTCPICNLSLK